MIHAEIRTSTEVEVRYGKPREVMRCRLVDRSTGLELSRETVLSAFALQEITGVCVKVKVAYLGGEGPSYGVIDRYEGDRVYLIDTYTSAEVAMPRDRLRERYDID